MTTFRCKLVAVAALVLAPACSKQAEPASENYAFAEGDEDYDFINLTNASGSPLPPSGIEREMLDQQTNAIVESGERSRTSWEGYRQKSQAADTQARLERVEREQQRRNLEDAFR